MKAWMRIKTNKTYKGTPIKYFGETAKSKVGLKGNEIKKAGDQGWTEVEISSLTVVSSGWDQNVETMPVSATWETGPLTVQLLQAMSRATGDGGMEKGGGQILDIEIHVESHGTGGGARVSWGVVLQHAVVTNLFVSAGANLQTSATFAFDRVDVTTFDKGGKPTFGSAAHSTPDHAPAIQLAD